MKGLLIIATGIFLSLTLASLPSSGADAAGSSILHKVYWVNPDGSRGLAAEIVTIGHPGKDRHWVNPDGVHGTIGETKTGRSLVNSYVWINPDGLKGILGAATGDRESPGATAIAARD